MHTRNPFHDARDQKDHNATHRTAIKSESPGAPVRRVKSLRVVGQRPARWWTHEEDVLLVTCRCRACGVPVARVSVHARVQVLGAENGSVRERDFRSSLPVLRVMQSLCWWGTFRSGTVRQRVCVNTSRQ